MSGAGSKGGQGNGNDKDESTRMCLSPTKEPFFLSTRSRREQRWIEENVHPDAYQWFGNVLVVEHRFAWGLAQACSTRGWCCNDESCASANVLRKLTRTKTSKTPVVCSMWTTGSRQATDIRR